MSELYVSVDIESDGPIPGDNSMLSIGAAAFNDVGKMLNTFSVNLFPLSDGQQEPSTMKFWGENPEAWAALQLNRVHPLPAMEMFAGWLTTLGNSQPVYVGYPAAFDFGFTHWYFHHFLGKDPFGFSALDLKSYAAALLSTPFKATTKRNMPRAWFKKLVKHDHVAVNDAVGQGQLFFNMIQFRNENRRFDYGKQVR